MVQARGAGRRLLSATTSQLLSITRRTSSGLFAAKSVFWVICRRASHLTARLLPNGNSARAVLGHRHDFDRGTLRRAVAVDRQPHLLADRCQANQIAHLSGATNWQIVGLEDYIAAA